MGATAAIVICAYNDEEYIDAIVRAAVEQEYDGKEVIVVDDCSTDGTRRILEGISGVKLLRNESNLGLAASLTRGFAATDAPIVFSLHSDCLLRDRLWMKKMVEPFSDPSIGAVVSRRVYPPRSTLALGSRLFDTVCPQQLNLPDRTLTELDFFRDKADAYRREIIEKLGGWDRAFFTAGEDTDLSLKMRAAGYRIVLHPEAEVEYVFSSRQRSAWGGLRKALLYGRTAALLYRRHRYDGLQTRTYLWVLLSILTLLLPVTPALAASALLFATSFNRSFVFHRIRRSLPLGLFFLPFILLTPALAILAKSPVLTAAARSLPLAALHFIGLISLKNAARARRSGESLWLLPVCFAYAAAWHLVSGIGYAVGYAATAIDRSPESVSSSKLRT